VCLLALLLQACATTGAVGDIESEEDLPLEESGDEPLPPWEWRHQDEDREARRAEAVSALSGMRGVAGSVQEVGAELVFRFWAQNGALTLLSWKRAARGPSLAENLDSSLLGLEDHHLSTYVGTRTGEVSFILRQERRGWSLRSFTTAEGSKPPQAKALPVRRMDVPSNTRAQANAVASELARVLRVPEGGNASWVVDVTLDDDKVLGATTVRYESRGGPPSQKASPELAAHITQALLPFTHGVGPRTVRLSLEAAHLRTERHARWLVMGAETLHPESRASPDLVAEHYALYERILREWREETKTSIQQAGAVSAEFLATWFISSLALRGGFALFEAVAPRMVSILARGGSETVAWFRSFLSRVRPYEREEFHRLWMKAQSGELSAAEMVQLRTLMARFEKLLGTKLDREASKLLRRQANADFYNKLRPDLAKRLVNEFGARYPVHHRIPLEHAHCFPEMDINGLANLKALHSTVHERINNIWTAFRPVSSKASARDVRQVSDIVDRHFQRWYDTPYDPASEAALKEAEQLALQEVQKLLARIQ
jgi:hypothetical protein